MRGIYFKKQVSLTALLALAVAVVLLAPAGAAAVGTGAPDTGVVPDGYFSSWDPGIPGGIPDLSETEPFVTLNAADYGSTAANNARSAINGAITAAGAKAAETGEIQVVALSEGVFYTSGTITLNKSKVALRGAGAGKTFIRGTDNWTSGECIIIGTQSTGPNWNGIAIYDLAEDAKLNDTSVKITTGAHGYKPGDILVIDRLADGDQNGGFDGSTEWAGDLTHSVRGSSSMYGPFSEAPATGRRFVKQYIEVAGVDDQDASVIHLKGKINIDFPITAEYTTSKKRLYPQVWNCGAADMQYIGLEDITMQKLNVGDGNNNNGINIERNAAYCWVKDVETDGRYRISKTQTWRGIHIEINGFRNVISGCYVHDTGVDGAGAQSYGIRIQGTDCLIENNICNNLCKPVLAVASGGGNVIAYNYVPNTETIPKYWMESAFDVSHGSYCHADLYEGNMGANIAVDTTHGNNGFNVIFRNYATGDNRDDPGTKMPLRAIMDNGKNNELASIGNVLWTPDGEIAKNPQSRLFAMPPDVIGADEIPAELKHNNDSVPAVYAFTYADSAVAGPDNVYRKFYRHMDFDYLTGGINYADPDNVEVLPDSLYTTTAPAFFEGYAWPWVDSAGETDAERVKTLPALARYERILSESPEYKSCGCCDKCICTCDHTDGTDLYCKGECDCFCGCGCSCACCVDVGEGGAFTNLDLGLDKAVSLGSTSWGATTSMSWGFRDGYAGGAQFLTEDFMKYDYLHIKLSEPFAGGDDAENVCVFVSTDTSPGSPNNLSQIVMMVGHADNYLSSPDQTLVTMDLRALKASGRITNRVHVFFLEWGGNGFDKIERVYLSNQHNGGDGFDDLILTYAKSASLGSTSWGATTSLSWGFRDAYAGSSPFLTDDFMNYDYLHIKLDAPFVGGDKAENVCVFVSTDTSPGSANNLGQLVLMVGHADNYLTSPDQTLITMDLRAIKASGKITNRAHIFFLEWGGAGFTKFDSVYLSNAPDGIVPGGAANGGGYYYSGAYVPTYAVAFVDWDGAHIADHTVKRGADAGAPADPSREGYVFTGWDGVYTNVTSDLVLTAVYEPIYVPVINSVGIYAAETSDIKEPVEFTLYLKGANIVTAELEFELDGGDILTFTELLALNGFMPIDAGGGPVKWTPLENGAIKGEATIVYTVGADSYGFTSESPEDAAKFIYEAGSIGVAGMRLTGVRLYGLEEPGGPARLLDAGIVGGGASTSVVIVYSKYDLNKDGAIDAIDLAVVALYCQFTAADEGWDDYVKTVDAFGGKITASMCDFNGDGVIDMLDLVELYLSYAG